MKKNFKIFSIIVVALLLVCATVGFSVLAADEAAQSTPTVEIYKKNISYDDVIQLTYALDVDGMTEGQSVQIIFGESAFTVASKKNVSEYLSETTYVKGQKTGNNITIDGTTYPVIFSTGIDAGKMTTKIYAVPVIVDAEGNIVASGACVEYSLYDYAMARFEASPTADQKALYKALLDYGAAVQDLMLADGQTAPADGWADAYYKVAYYDATLVHPGTNTRDEALISKSEWLRAGEIYEVTAKDTYLNGHVFANFWANGEATDVATKTYAYAPTEVGVNKLCAVYAHDFTERGGHIKSEATDDAFGEYFYDCSYESCNIYDTSADAATYQFGLKTNYTSGTFVADAGQYYNDHGEYVGNSIATYTQSIGDWNQPAVTGIVSNAVQGYDHVFETDVEFADFDIVLGEKSDKVLGWFGLSCCSNKSNQHIFLGFTVHAVTDENGNVTSIKLNGGTTPSIELALDTWYNIRIVATANTNDFGSVAEIYINGVHIGTQLQYNAQTSVTSNTSIYGFSYTSRGMGNTLADENHKSGTVNFANTFYGTKVAHVHEYENLVIEANKVSDATSSSAAVYYKSCACGEAVSEETFVYGYPTFTAGAGVYYNNNGDYSGKKWDFSSTSGLFSRTNAIASVVNGELVANLGYTYGVFNLTGANIEGNKHVFETDLTFTAASGTKLTGTDANIAWFGLSNATSGGNTSQFAQIYVNALVDDESNIIGIGLSNAKLATNNSSAEKENSRFAKLELNKSYNFRMELEMSEVSGSYTVKCTIYINGAVASTVYVPANGAGVSDINQGITSISFQSRGSADSHVSGMTSSADVTMTMDNMFYGTYVPPIELGTGVYYNNAGSYQGKKLDFSTTQNLFSNGASASMVGVENEMLTADFGYLYSRFNLTGGNVSGNKHVFETDIRFDAENATLSGTDTNIGWIGLANTADGANSKQFASLYLNALTDSNNKVIGVGISNTTYATSANGASAANTRFASLELGKWYNFRIEIEISEGYVVTTSVYINDELVGSSYNPYNQAKETDINKAIASLALQSRGSSNNGETGTITSGDITAKFDNMFFGTIPAAE